MSNRLSAAVLADAIETFLAPMRCPPTPNTATGMHCAECCYGTGWVDVHSPAETAACEALDQALSALAAVRDERETCEHCLHAPCVCSDEGGDE